MINTTTASIPPFELPASNLLSEASRCAINKGRRALKAYLEQVQQAQSSIPENDRVARRAVEAEVFYQTDIYAELLRRYPVVIEEETIGGVPCEVFSPVDQVSPQYTDCVLLNFHGGGFMMGGRTNSRLESAPVAAVMGIKVVSVDYRMAPEYCHPAATDDAAAVYSALLADYAPDCLGVFGGSAGASLTAMLVARLIRHQIPRPAAVGLFAAGAFSWRDGDYGHIGPAIIEGLIGVKLGGMEENPYFKQVSRTDPEAFPGVDPEFCANCPPALLVSSTRDQILSSVIHTETQLRKQGVETALHIWDGLEHAFHYNPWLPESRELHNLVANFFQKHLRTI